jgi:hypothetical protein
MRNRVGHITRRKWLDWCVSAASILALVLMLYVLDVRVRSVLSARLVERPAETLIEGGEQVGSLMASAAGTARAYTADHRPLVTFTVAGLVLLALMLFRKD